MEYIGIARIIDSKQLNAARQKGKEELFKERLIADEKGWIRRSIALGLKERNLKPQAGSDIEFNIEYQDN